MQICTSALDDLAKAEIEAERSGPAPKTGEPRRLVLSVDHVLAGTRQRLQMPALIWARLCFQGSAAGITNCVAYLMCLRAALLSMKTSTLH